MPDRDIALANIDRLQSLELQGAALPYGVKARLFEAAQSVHEDSMVGGAARILSGPPRVIGIVTGAQVPEKMPLGENDGPLGSVILAQALRKIGHTVNFYTDEAAAMPIEKLLDWLEVEASVIRLERGNEDAQIEIANTLDVAVAVERLGGNPNGILYGATGVSRSDFRCNADTLFQEILALGKASIGIADGGNEIGCGKIHEIISQTLSELNYCDRTPCGGGGFSFRSVVISFNSPDPRAGKELITLFHFINGPTQTKRNFPRVCNHRYNKMWKMVVGRKLNNLRIDQHEP